MRDSRRSFATRRTCGDTWRSNETSSRARQGGNMAKAIISRRTALTGLGGAAVLAASGIGAPGILKAQDKIKIGFLSALTGLETILGETQLNCFKLAVA